jgi:hypothetical protein
LNGSVTLYLFAMLGVYEGTHANSTADDQVRTRRARASFNSFGR